MSSNRRTSLRDSNDNLASLLHHNSSRANRPMARKYVIRVVDKFCPTKKSSSQPQWKTVERTKEFTNIRDCLDCIKTTVAPCGQSSGGILQNGSTFETVLVEVLAGRELVFSSESTDFWEENTYNEILTSCLAKNSSSTDTSSCQSSPRRDNDSDHSDHES